MARPDSKTQVTIEHTRAIVAAMTSRCATTGTDGPDSAQNLGGSAVAVN